MWENRCEVIRDFVVWMDKEGLKEGLSGGRESRSLGNW